LYYHAIILWYVNPLGISLPMSNMNLNITLHVYI